MSSADRDVPQRSGKLWAGLALRWRGPHSEAPDGLDRPIEETADYPPVDIDVADDPPAPGWRTEPRPDANVSAGTSASVSAP